MFDHNFLEELMAIQKVDLFGDGSETALNWPKVLKRTPNAPAEYGSYRAWLDDSESDSEEEAEEVEEEEEDSDSEVPGVLGKRRRI